MKSTISSLTLLLISVFPSCGQDSFDNTMRKLYRNTVPLITSDSIRTDSETVLLDTRSPREFEVSHLPGAQMIDYDNFSKVDVKHIDKDTEIIVYCSVGYRSERIGEKLQKMGYKNVKNLYGGIFDWKNNGYEVVDENNQPTDSVHTYNKSWSRWLFNGIKVYE